MTGRLVLPVVAMLALALPSAEAAARGRARKAAAPKVDCEKLLPKEVRDQHLPGMSLETAPCESCLATCRLTRGDDRVTLAYDCNSPYGAKVKRELVGSGMKEGSGVGKASFTDLGRLIFWDKETGCQVTVTWLGGKSEQLVQLAKAAEAQLTKSAIGR